MIQELHRLASVGGNDSVCQIDTSLLCEKRDHGV